MIEKRHIAHIIKNAVVILVSLACGFTFGIHYTVLNKHPVDNAPDSATSPHQDSETEIQESSISQQLILTAKEISDSNRYTRIEEDYLNGNMDYSLLYYGLKDVNIELNGKQDKLENSIRDGSISLAEIFAFARLDAKNGYCTEYYQSQNGLSTFTYRYPNLNIRLVYDIYETPDGQQHLISDFAVYASSLQPLRVYADDTGRILDLEDWGVSYEISQTSPQNISLECMQIGGQHLGELSINGYYILSEKTRNRLNEINDQGSRFHDLTNTFLHNNVSTKITIDWSDIYGSIPSGSYKLCLELWDNYDKQSIHPLMQNFYDAQIYTIPFNIN